MSDFNNTVFYALYDGVVESIVPAGSSWQVTIRYDNGQTAVYTMDEINVNPCGRVNRGMILGKLKPLPVGGTISIGTRYSITGGGDLTADRTLNLVNDAATPGNLKYYGTDNAGTRGWYDLPGTSGGYTLPIATASVLGGVKIGSNINVASDGTISVAAPVAQVNTDWNAVSGVAQLLNKPVLFDGNYNSLSNKPTIPTNNNQITNGAGYITTAAHTHAIANAAGTQQFTYGIGENIRFEGTGSAAVSFDAANKKVIINATAGSGADGNKYITGLAFSGTDTKTLTATFNDGSTINSNTFADLQGSGGTTLTAPTGEVVFGTGTGTSSSPYFKWDNTLQQTIIAPSRTTGDDPFMLFSAGKAAGNSASVEYRRTDATQQALFSFTTGSALQPDGFIGTMGGTTKQIAVVLNNGANADGYFRFDNTNGLGVGTGAAINAWINKAGNITAVNPHQTTVATKILTDEGGIIKYRTPSEILSDIGATGGVGDGNNYHTAITAADGLISLSSSNGAPSISATASGNWNINAATATSVAWTGITGKPTFFDGDYNSLTNKPTIPTNNNQLTNGAGFITTAAHTHTVVGNAKSFTFGIGETITFEAGSNASIDLDTATKKVIVSAADTNTTYSATSVGSGLGHGDLWNVYYGVDGTQFQFRTLISGDGISIVPSSDNESLVINASKIAGKYTLATASVSSDYSVGSSGYMVKLPDLTIGSLDRVFTVPDPSSYQGEPILVLNANTSAKHWSFAGGAVANVTGTTISTVPDGVSSLLVSDGIKWIKVF